MVTAARPHIIIVGAGFGGLEAARALARAPADVTLIDRHNYHLFQPLLYQVATAALSRPILRSRSAPFFDASKTSPCCWTR
jgi:NADH:ubiquinone reductase (H+-translocating)